MSQLWEATCTECEYSWVAFITGSVWDGCEWLGCSINGEQGQGLTLLTLSCMV